LPFIDEPAPDTQAIRIISLGHTEGCRLISHVAGESTFPPDQDLYRVALDRVRAKAAEQSANAIMIRSYQVQSGPAGSRATALADIYACTFKDSGE
jgi:hypothetical protein